MEKKSSHDSVPATRVMQTCPLCNTVYDEQYSRILAGHGNANLVHTTCARCRSAVVALVVTGKNGVSSVGMLTDMNYDDALRFHADDAISIDDCVTLHQFLATPSFFGDAVATHYDVSIDRDTTKRKRAVGARKR
ncbi:MAG: hypothetical protein HY437_02250 [Candidatus Magasanikbacteria bacterium]|nr:hypothetical protein [Candidatus Magasanikbacteria bacterium]